jgi:hypothetical protein
MFFIMACPRLFQSTESFFHYARPRSPCKAVGFSGRSLTPSRRLTYRAGTRGSLLHKRCIRTLSKFFPRNNAYIPAGSPEMSLPRGRSAASPWRTPRAAPTFQVGRREEMIDVLAQASTVFRCRGGFSRVFSTFENLNLLVRLLN